jgi:FkbM family methyltransferase
MRIAFIVIGNSRRSNYLNGYNLRYGGGGGSGTDTSSVLVAEYLAKQGHEVVFVTDKMDSHLSINYEDYTPGKDYYGVKYTNIEFEGIEDKEFDILVSMLWFEDYENLPIKVTKSFIYWSHMQWVYGTDRFINYAKKCNVPIGLVHISEWEKEMNGYVFPHIKNRHSDSAVVTIPNPVFDEIITEVKNQNIVKKPGKFIFHASWARGGNVSVEAVRKLDIPDKEFHAFDYLMVIHDHEDSFFRMHNGVDKKTLFTHLAESEYFVYPLYTPYEDVHKDTFSCVVAEAIALGVIVVTYPLGALPENFKDYCVWLDPPEGADFEKMQKEPLSKDLERMFTCTENIVDKINYLEANPEIKQRFKNSGQDYILENFNSNKVGEMWVSFIDNLIEIKSKMGPAVNEEEEQIRKNEEEEYKKQKYEVEPIEYEVKNYNGDESAFFYVFRHCYIGYEIKAGKVWEPHLHKIFEQYINKESVVVEGGSHVGSHSVKLSKLCKELICFEPLKQSNSLLRKNLIRNNCNNVTVYNSGLSDKLSKTTFAWMPYGNVGASGLNDNPMGIPGGGAPNLEETEMYEVDLNNIDSLNLEKLDFIKLDVEGYEPRVINGAMNTIIKSRPVISLECWSDHYGGSDIEYTKSQFKMLLDIGYNIQQIGHSDWLFLP